MDAATRNQVVELLQSGEKLRARAIAADAIRKDPADEFAWMSMALALDDIAQKRDCLRRVLAINPANSSATQLLEEMSGPVVSRDPEHPAPTSDFDAKRPIEPPASQVSSLAHDTPIVVPSPAAEAIARVDGPPIPPAPKVSSARPGRPAWLLPTAIITLLVGLAGLAAIGMLAIQASNPPAAVILPTSGAPVATSIRFPTLPPEWTPTPVHPTATARPLPSTTPTIDVKSQATSPAGQTPSAAPAHLDYPIAYVITNGGARTAYISDGSSAGNVITGATQLLGWLPGGQRLLYTTAGDKSSYPLYTVAADGSQARQVSKLPGAIGSPIVSPDGRRVAIVTAIGKLPKSNLNLDVMNLDGSGRTMIYTIPELNNVLVASDWSPDGKRIALVQQQCVNGPIGTAVVLCDAELYVINNDGSGLHRLTTGVRGVRGPRWSPDGSQILFYIASPDEYDQFWSRLMLLRLDGSDPQALVLDGYTEINLEEPDWSPDGKLIVFRGLKGQASIYVIPSACFGAPKLCSWQDAIRLPVQAQYIGNFVWKGSPPLARNGAAAAPTIPAVTPLIPLTDTWAALGSYSGQDTSRTAPFSVASGTLRVSWNYTGPTNSKFAVSLVRGSTQEVFPLDGSFGSGSGVAMYFVLFAGSDYSFIIESLGQWTLDVAFKPSQ